MSGLKRLNLLDINFCCSSYTEHRRFHTKTKIKDVVRYFFPSPISRTFQPLQHDIVMVTK